MPWTTPRTWAIGEVVTASIMNAHVRDNLDYLYSAVGGLAPGVVVPYAGTSAPSGWLLADGGLYSRTIYSGLFAVVGTQFNTGGEAATDFRLPNLKGRVPVGIDAAQGEFDARGEVGGAKTHPLSVAELAGHGHPIGTLAVASHSHGPGTLTVASHNHGGGNHYHTFHEPTNNGGTSYYGIQMIGRTDAHVTRSDGIDYSGTILNAESPAVNSGVTGADSPGLTGALGTTGSGTAHNNLQPYIALHYIIKT